MYEAIVDSFKEEFKDILDVIVFPEPYLAASKGYCQHSIEIAKDKINTLDNKESYTCVGLDLGNNNTVVTVNNDF